MAININDCIREYGRYEFAEHFAVYESGMIGTIIEHVAYDNTGANDEANFDYAIEHDAEVVDAIKCGIAPATFAGDSLKDYIAHLGQMAWYDRNKDVIYKNIDECVLYTVLIILKSRYGVDYLADEQMEELKAIEYAKFDYLESVVSKAASVLGLHADN